MPSNRVISLRVEESVLEFVSTLLIAPNDTPSAALRRLIFMLQTTPQLAQLFHRFQTHQFGKQHLAPRPGDLARVEQEQPAIADLARSLNALSQAITDKQLNAVAAPVVVSGEDASTLHILRRMHTILEYLNTVTALDLSDAPKEKSDAVLRATRDRLRAFYSALPSAPAAAHNPPQNQGAVASTGRVTSGSPGS
jgi:hypothetical protein